MSQDLAIDKEVEEAGECINEDAPASPVTMPPDTAFPEEQLEVLEALDGRGAPLVHPCGPGVGGD